MKLIQVGIHVIESRMHEIDTPFSRRSKTFDDHIEVDLDIAIHGEQNETIPTLLAAACTKEGLDTPQGTDAPLAHAQVQVVTGNTQSRISRTIMLG